MKLFCSNAVTGENITLVEKRMRIVVDALRQAGHEPYCPVFDPHKTKLLQDEGAKAVIHYAFNNLSRCDGMVAIITSDRKSEGQLIEIGALLTTGKPLYLFIHSSVSSSNLPKLADKTFVWTSEQDLAERLSGL